jgi:hypothetical protein
LPDTGFSDGWHAFAARHETGLDQPILGRESMAHSDPTP